ncbi:hypothetical protein AC578_4736 [Pseudocercospora eumusae]|uniref:UBL3-like ubiquitin domain-containing protein n=1 Tax=Pseudocercospora eumusae TaxID=321146 RepID=A0A139HLC0_9PEZI|nr:hypothetical protein AC578_4736 [Pseudocercospora eumusae]
MASQADAAAGAAATNTAIDTSAAAKSVEMSKLQTTTAEPQTPASPAEFHDAFQSIPPTPAGNSAPVPPPQDPTPAAQPTLNLQETEHLGPATDSPIVHTPTNSGPVLSISLMLTTGARHPYKIDEKYLRNRKVEVKNSEGTFEPRELSGYQLKELIWTDWRSEWEPRPASPSSIRLIVMGRMIEDKSTLKDFPFHLANTNVVHMTVKPADLIDDDDTAGAKGTVKTGVMRSRDDGEGGAGCRCVIL